MEKRGKRSLKSELLKMTVGPILILGIFLVITSSGLFSKSMQSEVESGLKNISQTVLVTYDVAFPGDYAMRLAEGNGIQILKGSSVISGDYGIIDRIKKDTGIDVTFFYEDTRVITTITDEASERIIGTGVHPMVLQEVFEGKTEHFYNNAKIGGTEYYAYYEPVYNSDGSCIGMIAAAKPAKKVMKMIQSSVMLIVLLSIAAIIIASFISILFTNKLVEIIQEIKAFLSSVASGNLTSKLDEKVLSRNDEIGEMGRSTLDMQKAIRILIEQDALTGLYNRRSGERKVRAVWAKREKLPFAIAIGDIDFFKRVNDTYGHEAGDVVLKAVANVLRKNMQGRGFVARWGGEEFLIVYENAAWKVAVEGIKDILNHIRGEEVVYGTDRIQVTMTFGITEGSPNKGMNTLLREADEKLYYGKEHGRNQVVE